MQRFEKLLTGIMLGGVFPIFGFLLLWVVTVSMALPEWFIAVAALTGFLGGLVVDGIYLKRWLRKAYTINLHIAMAIYFFYTIGMLGFFMGVPIFNVLLAIPAGLYMGRRMMHYQVNREEQQRLTMKTCLFTTGVLTLVCITSATIALLDPFTIGFLQHIFHIPFNIKLWMLAGVIAAGGLLLVYLQWIITRMLIRRIFTASVISNILPAAIVQC